MPIRADDRCTMAGERPRYGLFVSALGAVVLAISVFLPWYGVSFTSHGIAFAQQVGNQVASQLGNATLQSYMASLHANLSGLAGHEFLSLSAHQTLKTLNVVLLFAGGLGLRARAARARRSGFGRGQSRAAGAARRGRVCLCSIPDDRAPVAVRRDVRAVASRGRVAVAARRHRDGRRGAVARPGRGRETAPGRRSGCLVAAVRLDARDLSRSPAAARLYAAERRAAALSCV